MNRAKANLLTRRVQVLALLFAAGAVAAGVIPLSATSGPVVADVPPAAPPRAAEPVVEVSVPTLVSAIELIAPPVVVKAKPPEPEPEPALPVAGVWKYLGAIIAGDYKRAVVTVDDRQRLVGEGTAVNATEVVEIDAAFIRIRDAAGAEQRINLAAKERTQLRIAGPTAGVAGGRNGATGAYRAGMERGGRSLMNPELAGQVAKAVRELRSNGLGEDDMREKLRGMFPNEHIDLEHALNEGGKGGGGKGGK